MLVCVRAPARARGANAWRENQLGRPRDARAWREKQLGHRTMVATPRRPGGARGCKPRPELAAVAEEEDPW